ATGEVIRTSDTEYPDLFWAIRGGGGNFGVVTRFEYRLHAIPDTMLAGQVLYPMERAGEILRFYRDTFRDAPDALACYPFFIRIPPLPIFPEVIHGDVVLDMVVCWTGDPEEGERWIAPFREQGGSLMDTVVRTPYTDLQTAFDAGMAYGNRWYTRWILLDEVGDDFIDALVEGLDPFPGALTAVYLGAMGGAVGRVPRDTTAYPHRDAVDALHIFPGWLDEGDDQQVMAWARGLYESLESFGAEGVYVNMLAEDEEGRLDDAHAENRERLVRIKNRWDPENFFRMNHNIPPSDP
ncbi:MAG TPA: BBE domain-containing protein, partial [Longimicrobiales bacterium]|nr:BBE domain-containing protein [Longimicrobiales bacterium]